MTDTPPPLTDEQLRDRMAAAIRAAAYDCDGNCGKTEAQCDAEHPIQVAVLHHGEIADVYGSVHAITTTVVAVLQPELDRLRFGLQQALPLADLGAKCFRDNHSALHAEARAIAGGEKFRADQAEAELDRLRAERDQARAAAFNEAIDRFRSLADLAPDSERAPGLNFAVGALMAMRDRAARAAS